MNSKIDYDLLCEVFSYNPIAKEDSIKLTEQLEELFDKQEFDSIEYGKLYKFPSIKYTIELDNPTSYIEKVMLNVYLLRDNDISTFLSDASMTSELRDSTIIIQSCTSDNTLNKSQVQKGLHHELLHAYEIFNKDRTSPFKVFDPYQIAISKVKNNKFKDEFDKNISFIIYGFNDAEINQRANEFHEELEDFKKSKSRTFTPKSLQTQQYYIGLFDELMQHLSKEDLSARLSNME